MLKNSSYKILPVRLPKRLPVKEPFFSFTKKVTRSEFLQIFSYHYIFRQSLGHYLLILKHKSEAYLEYVKILNG